MSPLRKRRWDTGPHSRVGPIHVLAAAAILGLLVMPVAFAAGGHPGAAKSASLIKQIKKLKRRVAALEARPVDQIPAPQVPASLPPSGPAGGGLSGAYPNPGLAQGSVTTPQIANGAVKGNHFGSSISAAANFGTIDAGNCAGITIALPAGINGDDHVLVTPRDFADTFTLTAEPILSAIQLVACNVFGGGGSADPDGASGTDYNVLVIEQD